MPDTFNFRMNFIQIRCVKVEHFGQNQKFAKPFKYKTEYYDKKFTIF